MSMTSATINISFKKHENYIYQYIIITPTKKNHFKYFTQPRYKIGRVVEDLLSKLYIGDGKNILFRKKNSFRNQTVIKYEVKNDEKIILSEKSLRVDGDAPKFDTCLSCKYFKKGSKNQNLCLLHRKFLPRVKKYCVDFVEKD